MVIAPLFFIVYMFQVLVCKKTARGCAVLSGNNRYAFVLLEELPEHDLLVFEALAFVLFDFVAALVVLVDFAAFALADFFAAADVLLLAVLLRVFLPTEPQAPHFLLAEVLVVLFLFLPNIVFTSRLCCKKDILPHLLCANFDKKYAPIS